MGPSHLDVPKGTQLLPSLTQPGGGDRAELFPEWFQLWQSPKKYLGQQLGDGEGTPNLEDVLQVTQSMERRKQ